MVDHMARVYTGELAALLAALMDRLCTGELAALLTGMFLRGVDVSGTLARSPRESKCPSTGIDSRLLKAT